MKIGINGFEAVVPRFGFDDKTGLPNRVGSSEVCFELLRGLSKIDNKNEYLIYLPSEPTTDLPKESDKWRYKVIPDRKLWTILGLNKTLIREKLDVFFSPTHYGPIFTSCPQVISILDISYKYFPELFNKKDLFKLNLWGKYSIIKAAKIITISQSSKDDIIKEYGISSDKIAVVHLGIKEIAKSKMKKEEVFKKYNISSPYILFVGTIQPRKNIKRLIEALSIIKKKNKEIALVIIGKKGWMYEETLNAPKELGVEDSVHFLDSVTDQELPLFYEAAIAFVLPSLYEGFGLPVLEAMKYGCPVLTSKISSLPEAGGKAALYFDPYDVNDIAEKITKVLEDEKLRSKMIKEGFKQVKKFSWEKAAREVLNVLENVK